MAKTVFWKFRTSLGLIKRRKSYFTYDEILLMDIASIFRWAGCGNEVLKNFCQFWKNPQAPTNLEDRVEQFLQHYCGSLKDLWEKVPSDIKTTEPAQFFQKLIGVDQNVQAE